MHFRDVMADFTAALQFAVLHGRTEIGLVDPMVLRGPHDGSLTVTLAGRGSRVTSIEWNRQKAQVEPSIVGGKVRWSGVPQPISGTLTRAIRRYLQERSPIASSSPGVFKRRSRPRGTSSCPSWASAISTSSPLRIGGVPGGGPGRGRENARTLAALPRVAPELLGEAPTWVNFGITLSSDVTVPETRRPGDPESNGARSGTRDE